MTTPSSVRPVLSALLVCLFFHLTPAATPQARGRATGPGSVVVPDPTLGIVQRSIPVLPGWQGTAQIDRTSDPLSFAMGTLATDLRSPDGKASVHMLAVPFHTFNVTRQFAQGMPGNPAAQRNAALIRFTSTADLLTQYILPALNRKGEAASRDQAPEQMKEQRRQGIAMQGTPRPIWDLASATYKEGERETLILAETTGGEAGTPREYTKTYITVVVAPLGQTEQVLLGQLKLPMSQPGAAWQQADARYLSDWRDQLAADTQRSTREFERGNAAILAQGQSNLHAMQARGAERDRAFALHEQQTSDLGANFRGYLSGTDVNFKWCGPGAVMYTTNDTRPPAASYRRCD